jgi:hypothetical protein
MLYNSNAPPHQSQLAGKWYRGIKADSHTACRACAVFLTCSDSAVSFVKVRVVARNI